MVKFKFFTQFPVDYLPHPVMSSLPLFLLYFAAFDYYMINHFHTFTILSTLALLLHLIYFCFNIVGIYGIVWCCCSNYNYYYYIYYCYSPVLTSGHSLKNEQQKTFTAPQNSFKYSKGMITISHLISPFSSLLFKLLRDCSSDINQNRYFHHIYVLPPYQLWQNLTIF